MTNDRGRSRGYCFVLVSLKFSAYSDGQLYCQPKQTAGPSTAPLAMRLREAPLRMTSLWHGFKTHHTRPDSRRKAPADAGAFLLWVSQTRLNEGDPLGEEITNEKK